MTIAICSACGHTGGDHADDCPVYLEAQKQN